VDRPPTAGWTGTPSRPGTGGRQPAEPRPLRTLPQPRARGPPPPRTRPGARAGPAGKPPARAMARRTMPDIAARSGPRGAETDLERPGWTQSLAGHQWPQLARHIGPTRHSNRRTCRLFRATDSDGTCRPPASTPPRVSPTGQGSDFRQDVPGDDPPKGPGATSECQNSRTAGPPARADQVLQRHSDRADPTATFR
jgi:hypothetical protein